MADSLDRVPCAENESAGLIHGVPRLHFLLLIHAYSSQIVLQTICCSALSTMVRIVVDTPVRKK